MGDILHIFFPLSSFTKSLILSLDILNISPPLFYPAIFLLDKCVHVCLPLINSSASNPPPVVPHCYQNYFSRTHWIILLSCLKSMLTFLLLIGSNLNSLTWPFRVLLSTWDLGFSLVIPYYKSYASYTLDCLKFVQPSFSLFSTLPGRCLPFQIYKIKEHGLHLLSALKCSLRVTPSLEFFFFSSSSWKKMRALESNPTSAIYCLCLGMLL